MKNHDIFSSTGNGDFVLQRAVESVQALADPSPPWAEILRSGRELVGAEGATFIVFEGHRLATFESVGNDHATERAYVDHYSAQDIMLEPEQPRAGGTWLDTEDKLSRIDRQHNAYYVDFMCGYRLRQIHSLVLEEGSRSAAISFQRATSRPDGAPCVRARASAAMCKPCWPLWRGATTGPASGCKSWKARRRCSAKA